MDQGIFSQRVEAEDNIEESLINSIKFLKKKKFSVQKSVNRTANNSNNLMDMHKAFPPRSSGTLSKLAQHQI